MKRIVRWALMSMAGLIAVVLVAAVVLYALSSRKLSAQHVVTAETELVVPTDSASIARGARLVGARPCGLCHGDDLGGNIIAENFLLGRLVAPNLSSGQGGLKPPRTDVEWERAMRHGVKRDGYALVLMPSRVFHAVADDEMAAMIAYLKQIPPVDRDLGPRTSGPLTRAFLAIGRFKTAVEETPTTPHAPSIDTTPGLNYGKYLVASSGCRLCHGESLSGGPPAFPGEPPFPNLTPAGIGHYSEDDFKRTMRTGRRPTGGPELNEIMPWKYFRTLTDDQLHSIWLVLQSTPAKTFGEK